MNASSKLLSLFRPRIAAAAAVALSCSLVQAAPAAKPAPLKVPTLHYEKYKLPNGLEVILHEDHRLPLVAIDLWYHVGPVNERPGRTGFAHLFEHMMFEGSEHVGEKAHIKVLEGAGASDVNGTTSFDRTNYFETLPSNEAELGLWLESDRMGFLLETLDRQKLTNQRDVVRNERRQGEGRPYSLGEDELYHQLFPKGHPYYAAVMGSHADIESARILDIRDFFAHYYTPNNASIAIAGDFDPKTLKPLIEKYFGPIPTGPPVDKVNVTTPPITSERRATVTDTVQLPRVTLAWIAPPAFAPGDAETDLLLQILGGGKSSRLYRKLVYEKQLAQSVSCDLESLRLGSVAECDLTARPGVKPEDLEAEFNKEIEDLRTHGPTQVELDRARTVHLTGTIQGLQRLGGFGGVADMMDFYNQYTGDPGYLPKDLARYQDATVASVQQLAQQKFGNNQRVVVYTVPGKKVVDDVPRSPDSTDADVKIVNPYTPEFEAAQDWRKTPPVPGPAPKFNLPIPSTFSLDNGLKVYLLEDHSLPVFQASLVELAGGERNPTDKAGLSSFTSRLLTEGTEKRSASQIADDSDAIGAQLGPSANMDSAGVSIGALSNNIDPAFDLLSDVSLHPAFKPEEIERIRKQRITSIKQEADQAVPPALRVGQRALYGDQPYGFRTSGTVEATTAATRDDLVGFYTANYTPGNGALLLAGDLTAAEAHHLAEQYFGGWKASSAAAVKPLPPAPAAPTRKVVIVDKPGAPQTALYAFGLGVPRNTPDYAAINVMNDILGGLFASRINMNLREKHGYTYGASSQFFYYRDGGPFLAGAQVRTNITGEAAEQLFLELGRIRTEPPTAEELRLAEDYALRSLPGRFETKAQVAGLMGELFTYNLPIDYYTKLPAQYQALTPEAVEKAAQDYIHPENLILVAVGDKAKIQPGLEKLNLGPIEVRDTSGNVVTDSK